MHVAIIILTVIKYFELQFFFEIFLIETCGDALIEIDVLRMSYSSVVNYDGHGDIFFLCFDLFSIIFGLKLVHL